MTAASRSAALGRRCYVAHSPVSVAAAWALLALLARTAAAQGEGENELVITNIMHDDPEGYVPWDSVMNRPVQFWTGDYNDLTAIACNRSGDLLFDWSSLKRSMIKWLKEMMRGTNRVMQVYWEAIRPVQHALTNIVAHHNITTSRDCLLGMLSVRIFYLVAQSESYRQTEMVVANNFVIDWYYFTHKFGWENLIRSGWGSVIFPSLHLIAMFSREHRPWLSWVDCESLPGAEDIIALGRDIDETVNTVEALTALMQALDQAPIEKVRSCPVAFAYGAIVVAYVSDNLKVSLQFLNKAQDFIRQYREANDWTVVNLMNVKWPFWQLLAMAVERVAGDLGSDAPETCDLLWCPDGGTPNPLTCKCEMIFQEDAPNVSVCFFMVDTRRKSSLRNITSVLNARFWTLTYGINRAYAEDHGYEIEYVLPDHDTHYPERKFGWGKVKVIIDRLREYGPDRCAYGVSIDTDAYMRTSEPLSSVIFNYGLDDDKLILFSQEYHTELRPNNTFANGGFFIVRNSPEGVGLLEEWYNVPEDYEHMRHLKKQNPQGLNLCWDQVMQPKHSDVVVLAPPHLFTAPLGWFVRHNWFKDLRFEQEMMDVLLQRLQRKYGCIVCQNVFDWDDSLNTDVGWR